jgi:hypothetical protein
MSNIAIEPKAQIEIKTGGKSRIIFALLLISIGVINYLIFGLEGGRYPPFGAALIFQGVSYFIVTGLFPLILGIIVLIHYILNIGQFSIKIFQDHFLIENHKLCHTDNAEIKQNLILGIKMENSQIEKQYLWLLITLPYMYWNLNSGIGNLFIPQLTGFPITGFLVTSSAISTLIIVIGLICSIPIRISFYTDQGIYSFRIYPMKNEMNQIKKFLNEFITNENMQNLKTIQNQTLVIQAWIMFAISLAGILGSVSIYGYQSEFVVWIAFYLSIIIGIQSWNDFSTIETPENKVKSSIFLSNNQNFEFYYINNNSPITSESQYQVSKIKGYTMILGGILLIWIPFAIIRVWIGVFSQQSLWIRALISSILNIIILFLVKQQFNESKQVFTIKNSQHPEISFTINQKRPCNIIPLIKNSNLNSTSSDAFLIQQKKRRICTNLIILFGIFMIFFF